MDAFVKSIADAMSGSLGAPLAVFLLSMIPIAEARFAIPFGMSMGLTPIQAFGYAFMGTTLITPILLLVLIPIITALSRTKLFSKIGKFLFDKFENKSRTLKSDGDATSATPPHDSENSAQNKRYKTFSINKTDLKRMGGTALFVAVPLPLTGVWTGSAVASICKIGFVKGLVSVILGNSVACGIITLISFLFAPYVNYITLVFFAIAVAVVVVLIIKLILFKPDQKSDVEHNDACKKTDNDTVKNTQSIGDDNNNDKDNSNDDKKESSAKNTLNDNNSEE